MRRSYFLPLSLCLLLAACGGDDLVLRFDTPVEAASGGLDPALRESLALALAERQFDEEQFRIELLDDKQSVRVVFADDPLPAERRQALRDLFDQRLEARRNWSGGMTLEIQPERFDQQLRSGTGILLAAPEREKFRRKVEGMRREFASELNFTGDIQLTYQPREQTFALATSTDEIFCQTSATLGKPLPELRYQLQGAAALGGLLQMMNQMAPLTIPHRLRFADQEMQASIDGERFATSLQAWRGAEDSRMREMVFNFGSIGSVQHINGTVYSSLDDREQECLARIIAAGRPFTFFYGRTLDRLQAVEYRFGEES
jgi:hypothetical protein